MPTHTQLYSTLGVAPTATAAEIKKAFRALAAKFHPDKNPGDKAAEARFKEVSAAYDVLSDADKRKNYDEFGADSLHSGFDAARARATSRRAPASAAGAGRAASGVSGASAVMAWSSTCATCSGAAAGAGAHRPCAKPRCTSSSRRPSPAWR